MRSDEYQEIQKKAAHYISESNCDEYLSAYQDDSPMIRKRPRVKVSLNEALKTVSDKGKVASIL